MIRLKALLLLAFIAVTLGVDNEEGNEKVWPECPSVAADKESSTPICDPCSPKVYTVYDNERNTEVYTKPVTNLNNYNLRGWYRFSVGSGRILDKCPLRYSCSGVYPIWLNSQHPAAEDGIVDGEFCSHFTSGVCCSRRQATSVKNCGNYFVYLLKFNSPVPSSYHGSYCVEPVEQPDVCGNDVLFSLVENTTPRGELLTKTSTLSETMASDNTNTWYTLTSGHGTIKRTCPGIHHCGYRYPMWIEDEYPLKDGEVMMTMGHAATSASDICTITNSQPLYIVKCGDKFYHKAQKTVTYSAFCVDEEIGDLCDRAITLTEEWRGTTVDRARDHCDTNGLTSFDNWYRIGVHEKKMPDACVAPNKCGADNGYYVGGNMGHPDPEDGIVGRTFYYSSSTNCEVSALQGHILNCGNQDDGDDFIYKWAKPAACTGASDKAFCAEQDPCSTQVYIKLDQEGRAGRSPSDQKISDINLQHGWYRFPEGEGIMTKSVVLPGHTGITYPGWYDGEIPLEEGDQKFGRACFRYNADNCYKPLPVTVKNCRNFHVYHLRTTPANFGYAFEEDVCALPTKTLDGEWRLQYNLGAITGSDATLEVGWYEVKLGLKQLASTPTLYKHGGNGKYPGWIEGTHPTEEEGIVERTVYFTTTDSNNKGRNTKVYIRNCGTKYIYYLRPYTANHFYAIGQELCNAGSYEEVEQPHRLFSNPSQLNRVQNNDNKFFHTFTGWYRFMNGNGRAAEWPKIQSNWHGGFQYGYQFPEGSHATVPTAGDISEPIPLIQWRAESQQQYLSWPWKVSIANCGGYFLYKIPPLSASYTRSGLVVDDEEESVCEPTRFTETGDKNRLVSSTSKDTGSSDNLLEEGWYKLTAGLGYMPTSIFIGTQCSSTYHGHLKNAHPTRADGIVPNQVEFRSTSINVQARTNIWVKACEGFYLYRLFPSPGSTHRYCEATPGCENGRELAGDWRVNSRRVSSGKHEGSNFGNDGWVYFTQGLGRMPESPPPLGVGGCKYSGYIDSHPNQEEGAVPRLMRFPGIEKTQPIEVENCGDGRYVYFLTKSITNDHCYVADTDVCSEDVYSEVSDERRLHYSHRYGTAHTRFDLDNKIVGWFRYTIGKGRMMEEAPALTGMCTTEYQGWINGKHPTVDEGTVSREVCWRHNGDNCESSNDISIKNCGNFYVYGMAKPPPNNQWGHCVEQDKASVCEAATKLNNPKRGMLTPTVEYVNDQLKIVQPGYYRFLSGLGRLTAFEVTEANCGGNNKMLIREVLEKDQTNGDALFKLQQFTTSFVGTEYRNIGLECDGYWVYNLEYITTAKLAYCVEEDVCKSSDIKRIYSTNYLQWLKETTDNEWDVLSNGWYEVKVGNKKLAYSPSDLNDCSALYPGYIASDPPSLTDGIVPGQICYRTRDGFTPTTCRSMSMKKCPDKELYYLKKSPSAQYAICVDTDVCTMVEGKPLDDTWRLSGTPSVAGGSDSFKVGWYKVSIGNERLAHSREEATCGTYKPGWIKLGRHPLMAEGTVNTEVCYDSGNGAESNCKNAQIVNCGSHYLYHLTPGGTNFGACVSSSDDMMCKNYQELSEPWRSSEYSSTIDKSDTTLTAGWYRFTTGLGRMPTVCGEYQTGGGHYPAWADGIPTMPSPEQGVVEFKIYWRHVNTCTWISARGFVRNCGTFPVYWLPKATTAHTTYTTEANSCSADQYTELDDERRLAWRPTTDFQTDGQLKSGWYRFMNGLQKINEECTPTSYGGTTYPGWMEGGHPGVNEIAQRTVYFRHGTNCKQTSKQIKVKNCGSFFIYRLVPTVNSYGYTVASDVCKIEPMLFDQEDRSIYTRNTNKLNDNGIKEGWYQFTTGRGVMPKSAPFDKSCRGTYSVWLKGEDPTVGEGTVTRSICAVNGANTCNWQKEIKVRNCGNNKMLYYFYTSPPHTSGRYCVDDSLDNVCNSAKAVNDQWRGANTPGTGHADRTGLLAGWYKFTSHGKKIANYPVPKNYCGADFPLWMNDNHAEKGSCGSKVLSQVHSNTYWWWRTGQIYECHCMNGDYIYYHDPTASILASYNSAYCLDEEPCENFDRYTGQSRSPWSNTVINPGDNANPPKWVKVDTGLRVMPTYVPELKTCGSNFPAWYDGELPTEVGETIKGRYCFRDSATNTCGYPRDARVKKCPGGDFVYHVLPTQNANYGYCADSDVCDVFSEEWGREEFSRLRYTSTSGFYSSSRKVDSTLETKWYRMTIGLKKMPTDCAGSYSCGGERPGWLNGEHPVPADRVVDRDVCFTTSTSECCGHTQKIKVVACSQAGQEFYMYRLYKTPNLYRYCIDENPEDVCKIPAGSIAHVNEERHGTGHYKDTGFPNDFNLYKIPQWMQINVQSKHFIHYPPTRDFCGCTYPGWVEDPAPGPNDGVVESKACFRESEANEQCYQARPIKVKNCNGKMMYLYSPPNAAYRNMCVEEDICQAANHETYNAETWRLAFTKTNGEYKSDYRKMDTSPYRGWFRFTGTGHNRITEIQQEYISCGVQYPGWLYGEHPTPEEGVVKRNLAFTTSATAYTSKKQEIFVRNCGDFVIYNVDFNFWNAKWGLCMDTDVCEADVNEIKEDHRLLNVWGLISQSADNSLARGWYRFTNGFEKMPEKCPIADSCGAKKPGYLAQPHPGIKEGIVARKVCFGDVDQCCTTSRDVLVKNCGTHFVYRLYPTAGDEKYCVEESPNTMCDSEQHTELEDDWRGENTPYDTANKHNDNTGIIAGNWYRFMIHLGRMPEYSMSSSSSCGTSYPGYLNDKHPEKNEGIVNRNVCFSTSKTNEGVSCTPARVRNCGSYYLYQLKKSPNLNYGYCVAQDPCKDAVEISDRWRLIVNPYVSSQSKAADQTRPKGWYRFTVGHGTMPQYETEKNYGGQAYPSYMLGDLPTEDEGEVKRIAQFGGANNYPRDIRVKNCEGEYFVYWLQPTQAATYVYSVDTDVCLHSRKLDEEWRNMFYVSEGEDDLHTDYQKGKDWYHFTTGFQMMAEAPPAEKFSCGTVHAAYLNQPHPAVEDGVVQREVCYKENEEKIYQACYKVENIKVKNCGDFYSYQLNPQTEDAAYCVYNRKTSCSPKVVHAKYGEVAVVNCTLNSEKDFDSSEVEWTKLNTITLPDPSQDNIEISEDRLLLNIHDIADQNAGIYALFIPSTSTSELVEVVLYSAVEAAQKYYIVEEGGDVQIEVSFNVLPEPSPADITWVKAPSKKLTGGKYELATDKKSLKIKQVTESETGTYRISVSFEVAGVKYNKHAEVVVKLEEPEEEVKAT